MTAFTESVPPAASTISARATDVDAKRHVGRRRETWDRLRWLWRESSLTRVKKCRRTPGRESVDVRVANGRAGFVGLTTCGSWWSCPACSAKIGAQRTGDLGELLRWAAAQGHGVELVTLTMRHHRGQTLADLWDGLTKAWTAARGGHRSARRALDRAGLVGWTRAVEATHGEDNGWHVHIHALLITRTPLDAERRAALRSGMFTAWSTRLGSLGFGAPNRDNGIRVDPIALTEDGAAEAAGYLAKKALDSAAAELQSSGKFGRGSNRTPWQLLDAARAGDVPSAMRWFEWESGSFNRRALTWSRGLRDAAGLGAEVADEDVEQDGDEETTDWSSLDAATVATIDGLTWATLRSAPRGPERILEAAESGWQAGRSREAVEDVLRQIRGPDSAPGPGSVRRAGTPSTKP